MTWFDHFQVASSRWLNVMLGGRCDEMLSSRCYREDHWLMFWLDLFFWATTGEIEHCRMCHEWEKSFNSKDGGR